MLDLIKLSGEETGVADEFKMDWESQGIDFYEDVAYGMGGDHPMHLDLMIPREKAEKNVLLSSGFTAAAGASRN